MANVGELLTSGTARLRAAGSESARLDTELLLGWALGAERTALIAHPEAPVGADAAAAFEGAVLRREAGEPVAYIRSLKEFYGLAFGVDRRALIPRPETELLVAQAEREVAWRLTSAPRPAGTPKLRVVDVVRARSRSRWRRCCGGGGCSPRSRSSRSTARPTP